MRTHVVGCVDENCIVLADDLVSEHKLLIVLILFWLFFFQYTGKEMTHSGETVYYSKGKQKANYSCYSC